MKRNNYWEVLLLEFQLPPPCVGSSLENYTSNNTTEHKTTRIQHDTTRDNTSTRRDNTSITWHNTSTTRVQNNIKFTLICLYHRCMLGAWYIRLYTFVDVVKLWKMKIVFPSNRQNRTKSQGSGLLQLCFCRFVYWNNFNCIFLRFETFYEKVLSEFNCSRIVHVWNIFRKKVSTW